MKSNSMLAALMLAFSLCLAMEGHDHGKAGAGCPMSKKQCSMSETCLAKEAAGPYSVVLCKGEEKGEANICIRDSAGKEVAVESLKVMGGKVDPKYTTVYKGQTIGFCCPACLPEFTKNPEKYMKKLTGKPSVSHEEAVEEALCFGWINSQIHRLDDERFMQKYTPRKPQSPWSKINITNSPAPPRQGIPPYRPIGA